MAIWFFTYGDKKFEKSKLRIEKEAEESGFFHKITLFGPEDIDEAFLENTRPYISCERGGGYWLWKPYFIKQVFSQMKEDDCCVYLDAGFTINKKGKKRFFEYIKMLENSESGLLVFHLGEHGWLENHWTNEATLKYFDCGIAIRNSPQILTGAIMFKKTKISCKVIDEFYNTALLRPDLFSDQYHDYQNPSFKEHRHDQSIFSILAKKHNALQLQDELEPRPPHDWILLNQKGKIKPQYELWPFLGTRLLDSKLKKRGFWLTKICQYLTKNGRC